MRPGALVAWRDEFGAPHVARVKKVDGDTATVVYGPITRTLPVGELEERADRDGRGRPRACSAA